MRIDYKKIIKSRSLRLKILRLLSFIPDKTMLKIQYQIKTGNKLNLKNPQRFTEKLQWYKLYYKNPLMIQCVDKYEVREYVKSKGLENILIPCYGVYDSVDEVDWDALPNQFVMKDTLGGGGVSVIIVKDKASANIDKLKAKAAEWTSIDTHKKDGGREWPYYSGKNHRILFEKYIDSNPDEGGLIDYKFFCFNGNTACVYVIADRKLSNGAGLGIYDSTFKKIDALRMDEEPLKRFVEKPENYENLKKVAETLSLDFPEARIDLYDIEGEVKFGEITFYDGSGYMKFKPDKFDYELGKKFKLPAKKLLGGGKIGTVRIVLQMSKDEHGLLDYKFFCFNGKVEILYVMGNRRVGEEVSVSVFDRDFQKLDVKRKGDQLLTDVVKPRNYLELRKTAETIAQGFPHVRVDLYDCQDKIFFGEMTFYNASGYMRYDPDLFDYELGQKFIIGGER